MRQDDPTALGERSGLGQVDRREVQAGDTGARPGQADGVEADVTLQVDHLQPRYLADRPTKGFLLNVSERGRPGHQSLRVVEPVLAVYSARSLRGG